MLLESHAEVTTKVVEEDKSEIESLTEEQQQNQARLTTPTVIATLTTTSTVSNNGTEEETNNNISDIVWDKIVKMNGNSRAAMTLNVADPAGKPLYAVTPTDSVVSMEESSVATPSEIAIGIHESDSTTKLQPDSGNKKNQDSSESLISQTKKEKWCTIMVQVSFPYIIAGLGMVGAGLLLDIVKEWSVFKEIPEFLVLVTPLLGLKGNLEMTLASRLSTQANVGTLHGEHKWKICRGNLCLVQVQAVVVGFLASMVAVLVGVILPGNKKFVLSHALLLCTSSMLTASVASLFLGVIMVVVVLYSRKFNINPDNVATPIAASLGDVTTLFLLAIFARVLYTDMIDPWVCPVIVGLFFVTTPVWVYWTHRNEFTREVLISGWPPVIVAMIISSGGGFILDKAEQQFSQLALYQPVINGVGGNLVSVQASRISTSLHKDSIFGILPGKIPGVPGSPWKSPVAVFMGKGVESTAARVLLAVVIPGHIIFTTLTYLISSDAVYTLPFMVFYLSAALIQVAVLLYIASIMVGYMWQRRIDPDTNAIPYLTAFGDLIGTGLLYLAFLLINSVFGYNFTKSAAPLLN